MKTKEEIIDHVINVGYNESARKEICAFLVGKNIKSKDEIITFKKGYRTFNEFYKWFDDDCRELWDAFHTFKCHSKIKADDNINKYKNVELKFKVGDWRRDKRPHICGKVSAIDGDSGHYIISKWYAY